MPEPRWIIPLRTAETVSPALVGAKAANLMHLARMIEDAGGIPAHGNQRSTWDAGCRFDNPNPEHR